jgi:glycosyltransferase involved in cell wall biosynthesis
MPPPSADMRPAMNAESLMRAMTTSCLINSHNYVRFVREAVESALGQTTPFDEIIVVDDGSTDGSAEMLASNYAGHDRVRILAKHNEGQLSCFNEGFVRAKGEIVFFLDADDILEPDYVAQALEIYRTQKDVDFVFCGQRLFGEDDRVYLQYERDFDLGYSTVLTALKQHWIGAPTSCLSMRRSLLAKILPLPFVESWRIRADDCLVFGSSLAGARKYFLAQPLVRYRVHSQNRHFGRDQDKFANYRRRLAINTLFEHFHRKLCFDPAQFGDLMHREFRTIARPTRRHLRHYSRLVLRSNVPLIRRVTRFVDMLSYYLKARFKAASETPAATSSGRPSLSPQLSRESLPTGQNPSTRKAA